jgi:hypothetical protein
MAMTGAGPRSMRRHHIPQQSDGMLMTQEASKTAGQLNASHGASHRALQRGEHCKLTSRHVCASTVLITDWLPSGTTNGALLLETSSLTRSAGRLRRYVLPLKADSRLNLYLG